MPRKPTSAAVDDFTTPGKTVIDTPLQDEASDSFLDYAYSVIHSRALPDARDGLKPVHRRILFSMHQSGLRPDHAHVKCARIVGDCMGRYHPHGDSAIYEALVRLGQDFATNTPLIDPHGNFGSPNDPAAAMRYTEARLTPLAMNMVSELGENTVDMTDNYDGSLQEPAVLPAEYPYLLVNGATGIAVGMATKMAPHNLGEIIALTRAMLDNPDLTVHDAMRIVPGPDFPTGGTIIGEDGILDAYTTGRGTIRIRATAEISHLEGSRGRQAITITSLPYEIGTEKVIESIKSEIAKKRLDGVSDVKDLSDRNHGTRLQIECKAGINPETLLRELYRLTPLEVTFGIANLALVDGGPRTLGLLELVAVFIQHRRETVTRRTQYRLDKALDRLHIVDGLLIALNNIDAVVKTIKASETTAAARTALMGQFALSETQATHILDMPLRRIVSLEVRTLETEKDELLVQIAAYREILSGPATLNALIDTELDAIAQTHAQPRQTQISRGSLEEAVAASKPQQPLKEQDAPSLVALSVNGLLSRYAVDSPPPAKLTKDSVHVATALTSTHGTFLAITSLGNAHRIQTLDVPASTTSDGPAPGTPITQYVSLAPGETVIAVTPSETIDDSALGLFIATAAGNVKIVSPQWPVRSDTFEVISLDQGDRAVSAGWATTADLITLVTDDAQLLTFPAAKVRPQGRSGTGVTGIKLAAGAHVIHGAATNPSADATVVTHTGASTKLTPLAEFPQKGRATGGVRCHRFLKGETALVIAHVGTGPVGFNERGKVVALPAPTDKRDTSGTATETLKIVAPSGR